VRKLEKKFELLKKIQREKKAAVIKAGKNCKLPKGGNSDISADLLLKGLPPCESDANMNRNRKNELRM
jgi:hypothetical protein